MTTIPNTYISETYTSNNGTKYHLLSFDITFLHSPANVLAFNHNQYEFHQAIKRDLEANAQREYAAENEITRQKTKDELFQIALVREAEKQSVRQARADAEAQAQADKEALSKTTPEVVQICESNLHSFCKQLQLWAGKKYTFDENSLDVVFPNFFMVSMLKAAK